MVRVLKVGGIEFEIGEWHGIRIFKSPLMSREEIRLGLGMDDTPLFRSLLRK